MITASEIKARLIRTSRAFSPLVQGGGRRSRTTTFPLWLRSTRCFASRRSRSLGLTSLSPSTCLSCLVTYLTLNRDSLPGRRQTRTPPDLLRCSRSCSLRLRGTVFHRSPVSRFSQSSSSVSNSAAGRSRTPHLSKRAPLLRTGLVLLVTWVRGVVLGTTGGGEK